MVKIYKLIDPRDQRIRYIGKTKGRLCDRLKVHVFQSKKSTNPSPKELWVKELIKEGKRPIAEIICLVDKSRWEEEETKQIKLHVDLGCELTNMSTGGTSRNGIKPTQENIDRFVEMMKSMPHPMLGKHWTEEQKEKRRLTPAWNKGMTGIYNHTEEHKQMMSKIMSDNHPTAKLSKQDVLSIIDRFNKGECSKELSIKYGVSYSHIRKVINKKTHLSLWR